MHSGLRELRGSETQKVCRAVEGRATLGSSSVEQDGLVDLVGFVRFRILFGAVEPIVPAVAFFGDFGLRLGDGLGGLFVPRFFEFGEEAAVGVVAQQVAGVDVGFGPGFFRGLG